VHPRIGKEFLDILADNAIRDILNRWIRAIASGVDWAGKRIRTHDIITAPDRECHPETFEVREGHTPVNNCEPRTQRREPTHLQSRTLETNIMGFISCDNNV
jgi:hypothetical protein